MNGSFGIQLYSLRHEIAANTAGTLEDIVRAGYHSVELARCSDIQAPGLRKLIEKNGLRIIGGHVDLSDLETRLEETAHTMNSVGAKYVTLAWAEFKKDDGATELATRLNQYGKMLKSYHLQLCYHNHAHEFSSFGNKTILDLLFAQTDPEYVQFEIDTGHAAVGGQNPAQLIRKYRGRCPLIHLRDVQKGAAMGSVEVGYGVLDIPDILKAAREAGTEHVIVEQDKFSGSPIKSIKTSADYLRSTILD